MIFLLVPRLEYGLLPNGQISLDLDFVREQQEKENHEANVFEAGLRYQFTPLTVLALGTGVGIGDESPDFQATACFQRSF